MPIFNQKGSLREAGVIHLLIPILLILGIIAGVYLIISGPLKLFPKAASEPVTGPSVFGKAVKFAGSESVQAAVTVPHNNSLNHSSNFTIELWFKPEAPRTQISYQDSYTLVAKGREKYQQVPYSLSYTATPQSDGKVQYGYNFAVASSQFSCGTAGLNSLNGSVLPQSEFTIPVSQLTTWRHVAAVINGGKLSIYENGRLIAKDDRVFDVGSCNNTTDGIIMGARLSGIDGTVMNSATFQMDEVRISNMVRYSASFTSPSTIFAPDANTIALYHFDGNANDSSNNGNNGQIVGAVQFVDSTIGMVSTPTPTATPSATSSPVPTPKPTVAPTPTPAPLSISANPSTLTGSGSTTLTYVINGSTKSCSLSRSNTTGVNISGNWSGTVKGADVSLGSHTRSLTLTNTTSVTRTPSFTITCSIGGVSRSASATVTLNPIAKPTVTLSANPTTLAKAATVNQ